MPIIFFLLYQDHVQLSAKYNNTYNLEGEVNLTCTMMSYTCCTVIPGVIPGTPIEIKAYAVQNNRRSVPDVAYHSTSKILCLWGSGGSMS